MRGVLSDWGTVVKGRGTSRLSRIGVGSARRVVPAHWVVSLPTREWSRGQ